MKAHFRYAAYVIRHRWFVLVECCRAGMLWRGLLHDLSKLRFDEWLPYAAYFYGDYGAGFDSKVMLAPHYNYSIGICRDDAVALHDKTDFRFNLAWLLHQKRNDHHWQWWILPEDNGDTKVLPMSRAARAEMLCDWRGAGRAQGYGDNTVSWYLKNRWRMALHPETRAWIETELEVGKDD